MVLGQLSPRKIAPQPTPTVTGGNFPRGGENYSDTGNIFNKLFSGLFETFYQ